MFDLPILSLLMWLPILGGLGVLAVNDRLGPRQFALGVTVVTFLVSLILFFGFDRTTADMQFQEMLPWISSFHINYH